MKRLFVLMILCLFTALSACSDFEKLNVADGAEEEGGSGNPDNGIGSFSGSVGTFSMTSVVAAYYIDNGDDTVSVLLADADICCDCSKQTVDANLILVNNIPGSEGDYVESTDDLSMEMELLTVEAGDSAATLADSTSDVSITIESITDSVAAGIYEGTFDSGDAISGTFSATLCTSGN